MTTRLIFVDNHPVTRLGLALMVNGQPDLQSVGEAGTAAEAIGLIGALRPDVVTIGLSLPDRPGLELAAELRDRFEGLGIVIFTARGEDDVLFRALETGASAFVSKAASSPEILGAIRHAAVSASSFSSRGLAAALRRRQEAPRCRRSASGSARCSACCWRACRYPTWRSGCTSAPRRPRPTSPASTTSWAPTARPRPC